MRSRRLAGGLAGVLALSTIVVIAGQAPTSSKTTTSNTLRTPWGEPNLQGIWNGETLTPLVRPAKYADKPVLSAEEAAAVEADVASRAGRDDRSKKGTEKDVAGAYNEFWLPSAKHLSDRRTSLIVDPPDGRIPPMTPEGQKRTAVVRDYLQALLQGTATRPGPISARRNDPPPMYNVDRMNRADGPEDRSTMERCFGGNLPLFTGLNPVYRIVQSPGQVALSEDQLQGHGFARIIPIDNSPHLPARIRLWHGDARGHWEGDTLVVDVTNFTEKSDFFGSRENLHLIERFTRVSDNRLNYRVTIEDPTTWTRSWTVDMPWERQSDKANEVYESNCQEGNLGLIGMLVNVRASERLFREGKGSDPATQDNATPGDGTGGIGR